MGRPPRWTQLALVGPGSELQLTLDGRAVPHESVVAAGPVEHEDGPRPFPASPPPWPARP